MCETVPLDTGIKFALACTNEQAKKDAAAFPYLYVAMGTEKKPIGVAMLYPIHPQKGIGWVVEHMCWLSEATPRQRVEAAAALYTNNQPMMGYSRKRDEKFFKLLQKNKIIKRAGKSGLVFDDQIATVWENYS
jgi:hypothetical protein